MARLLAGTADVPHSLRLEDRVRTDTDITIAYFSEHFKNGVPSIYREPQGRITVIK